MAAVSEERPWSAERCAQALSKSKQTKTGWKACCPAHEDAEPSLFLADGKDGLALVCYAGCDYGSIAKALREKGAILNGQRDPTQIPLEHFQLGAYHAHWDYHDPAGRTVLRVCRWEQPGGKKDIRPLVRNEEGGWKWGHHPTPRPLFQLDKLCSEPEAEVVLVEGEKTAAAAQRLFPERIATTWPGGAAAMGQADWEPLRGREVILVPDCDVPGRKAMAWAVTHLKAVARTVRIVDPARLVPELPAGWDLADALVEKRDVSKWLAPELAPKPRLIELGFTVHEARLQLELPYLVKDLFDRAQLVVLWGAPGSGKTFLALHLACHIGAGLPWVGRRVKPGSVLYVCSESTRKRLENRVSLLRQSVPELATAKVIFVPVHLDLLRGEEDIVDVIAAANHVPDIALVVVDTLAVTFGAGDENAPEDMSGYVSNMKRIKAETGAAVLIVHHSGKDESRGMRGHSALIGAIDAELSIEQMEAATPEQPTRMLKSGKLREGESHADLFAFNLEVRVLGRDQDGDPVTTCVVTPSSVSGRAVRRPSVGTQARLLAALEQSYLDGSVAWTGREVRALAKALMSRNSISGAFISLCQSGFLRPSVGGYTLGSPPDKNAQNAQ